MNKTKCDECKQEGIISLVCERCIAGFIMKGRKEREDEIVEMLNQEDIDNYSLIKKLIKQIKEQKE